MLFNHDIAKLLQHAKPLEPTLIQFEELADTITPYATEYRYPDFDAFALELTDVDSAMRYAESIFEVVKSKIDEHS